MRPFTDLSSLLFPRLADEDTQAFMTATNTFLYDGHARNQGSSLPNLQFRIGHHMGINTTYGHKMNTNEH